VVASQVPTSWHWSVVVQVTGFAPTQAPAWQESLCVQAFPSLQLVPSAFAGFEQAPVVASHVPPSSHWSVLVQVTGFAPSQAHAWQGSFCVQASASLQVVPPALPGSEQVPVVASQVPASWHWSVVAQVTGFAPTQAPAWQESLWVQALPSLQLVPSAFAGFEHVPVCGSQVPALWHWSVAVHATGVPPRRAPGGDEALVVLAVGSV